jgi:NAD(P)-dependent dehydrogenase (short-subunit alcohol dehydrogenase family)
MSAGLAGRTAVVTGASRGIGASIAEALAQRGAELALLARDVAPLEALVSRLPVRALALAADVSDPGSVRAAFARIREQFPRIDILVNNAGQARSAPFTRTDFALWQSMLAVNLNGAFLCTQEVYAPMLKQDYGRIVNIASVAGVTGLAYVSAYCAAKHGLIGLTRALAREAAPSALTVNAVCPGYTDTDMVKDAVANIIAKTGKSADEARAALVANNPQRRMIQPTEVANAVLWLCLPGSESVTGQAIVLAGGEIM